MLLTMILTHFSISVLSVCVVVVGISVGIYDNYVEILNMETGSRGCLMM